MSLCLVQSIAYPPLSSLDNNLGSLVSEPADSLGIIADGDAEAAALLQQYLGGYATLRKFYDLRDEEVNLKKGHKPNLRPVARKKAAAASLLTVIASAADNIQGSLYDETQSAIVQVDGLLALLGEATVFIDRKSALPPPALPGLDILTRCLRANAHTQSLTDSPTPSRNRRPPNRAQAYLLPVRRMSEIDPRCCKRHQAASAAKRLTEEEHQRLDG